MAQMEANSTNMLILLLVVNLKHPLAGAECQELLPPHLLSRDPERV